MSSSFTSWLKYYLTGKTEKWTSNLREEFEKNYKSTVHPDFVKEGIIESYRVATDIFKSLVTAIGTGLVSWMVAQIPATAMEIPFQWNLLIIVVAAVLVISLHLRTNYKISILNSQMEAICRVKGTILRVPPPPHS